MNGSNISNTSLRILEWVFEKDNCKILICKISNISDKKSKRKDFDFLWRFWLSSRYFVAFREYVIHPKIFWKLSKTASHFFLIQSRLILERGGGASNTTPLCRNSLEIIPTGVGLNFSVIRGVFYQQWSLSHQFKIYCFWLHFFER